MELNHKLNNDPEIDIHELLSILWKSRVFILKTIAFSLLIGLIVAISIPKEYTTTIKIVPVESKSSITGDMSNLAAMAGINLGMESSEGLSYVLYPEIIKSMPFITDLIKTSVSIKGMSEKSTLFSYIDKDIKSPWWNKIFGLPFKIKNIFTPGEKTHNNEILNSYNLTLKQDEVIKNLKNRISISNDKKTGIISIGVTLQDPNLSATVGDSLVSKLERAISTYKTKKSLRDFYFASRMYDDAKREYFNAQNKYARFLDENKNIVFESVKIEQERLKNEQTLTFNVYSTLAQKVTQAKLKVQEQTPVITILEPSRVPTKKSNISGLIILIWFAILGSVLSISKVLFIKKVKA